MSTSSRPEVRTGTPGKARPSSSAVRRAPVTAARSRRPPQCGQVYAVGDVPAPAAGGDGLRGAAAPAARRSGRSGPGCGSRRRRRRAGIRGGAPAPAPARRRRARRAPPARPGSAAGRSPRRGRGPAAGRRRSAPPPAYAPRTVARSATISLAQPVSTSSCASAVRVKPPTSAAAPASCARVSSTSRACGYGRPRLGVQVVAVVPDRDQAEVVDRGEHRRPGADHGGDPAAPGGAGRRR